MNRLGFTLVEILTAVIIVAILTVMAVPLYEKTIERSQLAEARTILNRLQAAKIAAMDNMGCSAYSTSDSNCPQLQHLNVSFTDGATGYAFVTKNFAYSIFPNSTSIRRNGVCAKRLCGEYAGTLFYYQGERDDLEPKLLCGGAHCEDYGLTNNADLVPCSYVGNYHCAN